MAAASCPLVQVLVSTYNGERYLREQLDSLLAQDYENLRILVRDDGSTDSTLGVLREYEGLPEVEVRRGRNVGVVRSFFELLDMASPEAAYVAFCDQDDVWLPGKVSQAVELLKEHVPPDVPGLYCSRYTIVDHSLRVLAYADVPERGPAFENALVQNIAPGCTMLLNRAALTLLAGRVPGPSVPVHDWWAYLAITALGQVVYDPRSFLLYRQHGHNAIGAESGFFRKWSRRLRRFLNQSGLCVVTQQAAECDRLYGHLLPQKRAQVLHEFLTSRTGFLNRLRYAVRSPVYRQSVVDDLILKVLLVMNRI